MDPDQPGIHQAHLDDDLGPGGESWTPILSFAQFPENGTASAQHAATLRRPSRLPQILEQRITDLQKACFVKARTVKAYFESVDGAGRDG